LDRENAVSLLHINDAPEAERAIPELIAGTDSSFESPSILEQGRLST
jgi:hypothetical protein